MNNVLAGLVFLRVTSFRNALVARVQRLRQPKYLVGAIIGVAYLYFVFFRRMRPSSGAAALADAFPTDQSSMVMTLGACGLLLFSALCWLWPRERAALGFSEADIAFLFPAPVTRQMLIHFRLIDSQIRLILTAVILGLISNRWSFITGDAWIRIVGWWLAFATVSLHITGSAFVITKWLERGVSQLQRQLGAAFAIAIVFAATLLSSASAPASAAASVIDWPALKDAFMRFADQGLLRYLLLPAKWVIQPLLARDAHAFLIALGPALGMFAAHYVWVLYSEVSFEEASIARAQKRAARVAAVRAGKGLQLGRTAAKARRPAFNVGIAPRVELAFLWKNLLSSAEYVRLRTALIAAAIIVVGSTWLKANYAPISAGIGTFAAVFAVYVMIFGPMVARQDLRSDLPNMDILKAYPLRGWQVVLGQILSPAAILTVLLWLLVLTTALTFPAGRSQWLTDEVRLWGAIAAALLTPLLCVIELMVLNAAALTFPAWIQTGANRNAGIDVMGQRILFFAGLLLAIAVALLPASIAAGAIFLTAQALLGTTIAAVLAFSSIIAVLVIEIALGVKFLGNRFEKFDLSAEL